MEIKGKFVTLRAPRREDMRLICDMFNDPELENCVVGWAFPLSIEQQNAWFDKNLMDKDNFRFIIDTPEDGAVGIVTLTNIDWKNRSAMHGIKLSNKEKRGKGIGTDAVMALQRYVFDELGFHRLDGARFEFNVRSERLYKKCGWKDEGIKRDFAFKRGEWRNLIMMGVLETDYREAAEKLRYWDCISPE